MVQKDHILLCYLKRVGVFFMSKSFKKLVGILLFLGMAASSVIAADLPNLDRTDKVHDRRYQDSVNVYGRRSIRLNQSGFRPQDYKYAYVADPKATKFSVVDAKTGAESFSGSLSLIRSNAIKPNIWINGAFNSLESVYEFGDTTETTNTESLYRADFTKLSPTTPGEYFVVVGNDTSATFHIHPSIYNAILENSLKFFGIQRCGNTKSHFHGACHLQDGSRVGHDLTGGWHDCGDHFKVAETVGYASYVLSMVYLTYQDKAEDRYGNSYADTVFTDGIPDVLYEAKVGTDYIMKLYNASVEDGLIEKGDMYHTVGMSDFDHAFWDLPERQDKQSQAKGGPDRLVLKDIGTNVAGVYAAALANVAAGYKVYDPDYSDSLLEAAKTIYSKIVKPTFIKYGSEKEGEFSEKACARKGKATFYKTDPTDPIQFNGKGYYSGMGLCEDDAAAAATSLWYATGDTTYKYDLFNNKELNVNSHAVYDLAFFEAGYLGTGPGFNNSWATDYQNLFAYVLFSIQKLILNDPQVTAKYNISETERDALTKRVMAAFRKQIQTNTSGDSTAVTYPGSAGEPRESETKVQVTPPYNLVWPGFDWGVVRYNMGSAVAVFLLYELMQDERYLRVSLDNMYYALGANPWDISLLLGAGDKNPQHPHNRAANPDGYNAGAMPYKYKCPIGALMGGREPTKTLIEDWSKFTSTETCIDFSAQLLFPAQSLAQTLPIDAEGPLFSNIAGTPISDTEAIISWDANEVALVTVFYNTSPDLSTAKSVQQSKATKGGAITLEGLTLGETYYFFLEGMDTKRNMTTDDNHGQWYQFTMTKAATTISGVTICQVDNRSAKIYWWSSDRMNGVVNYGTSMSALNEAQNAEGGAVLFHEAKLTDLQPGTTYYFTVSSGITTDNNGGTGYSFTTDSYATYADLEIYIKPSSYQAECTNWQDCHEFFISISNNDSISFHDFEVRLYLGKSSNFQVITWTPLTQNWNGNGTMKSIKEISFGNPTPTNGEYYLPITIKDTLSVSGQMIFQVKFMDGGATFKDFDGGWSLIPHTASSDPAYFAGVDLTQAPYFTAQETEAVETDANGNKVISYVEDPYIVVYYHGKHIYGYGPDYTPENGPQVNRTVALNFTSPFISPHYSVETVDSSISYVGSSTVSPTGFLDDLEMNGVSQDFVYDASPRTDSFIFKKDSILGYGNNYVEWVSWHNHGANKSSQNQYDCACAIYRTNVEVDTITTPPEQRYLVFDKKQYVTYKGENGAHKAEVHVSLLDSTMALMDTVSITLELTTDNNTVQFYATYDATISITSITLINGEATFYVASSIADTTIMYARSSGGSKIEYQPASAELFIQDLPPWPIIEVAKMVDTDCDNKPDALNITLSKAYDDSASFIEVRYLYKSDTLTTTNIVSQSGKDIVLALNISDTTTNTNPSGYIALLSNYKGEIKNEEAQYLDGIAPTLLSISVLERMDTAKTDKVYMKFSEPISAPGEIWPIQLFATDKSTKAEAPTVLFSQLYNDSLNVWEFEIAFNADGSSAVTEGMFGQLLTTSSITDKSGNKVSEVCGQPILPITLKLLPIPLQYAVISDADEDGSAEHIDLQYSRAMDRKHIPDQISIIFGKAKPETLWVAGTFLTFTPDSLYASLNLPIPFSYGNTSGPYDGGTIGMNNAGKVAQHLGSDASYESNEILAKDSVGPVFVSAHLTRTDKFDLLDIEISEPVNIHDINQIFYRQKNGDADSAIYQNTIQSCALLGGNSHIQGIYLQNDKITINDGSLLRMQPKEFSALVDQNGNTPSLNNPWIPISGSGNPTIKFDIHLREQVTRPLATDLSLPGKSGIRFYALDVNTKKLDLIENGQIVQTGISPDLLRGAIWEIEMEVPRGASTSESAAWDALTFKLNMPIYSNLGSYVNRSLVRYVLTPDKHLSTAGKIKLYLEWPNMAVTGLQSENGRSVGTGAYIFKAQIDYIFTPNLSKDSKTISRFNYKDSYDKTEKFGVKRAK